MFFQVGGLKSEIDLLKAESAEEVRGLKSEIDLLKVESVDLVAKDILAEWSREVPQQERVSDKYAVLRNSVLEPKPGAAGQLNHALIRIANIAALPLIGQDMIGQTERVQLQILNQCVEYLLGTSNAVYACNMQAISP